MQFSAFLFTSLPQFVFNLTNPTAVISPNPTPNSSVTSKIPITINIEMSAPQIYSLPGLPYAYDALEPHISAQIMTLHHTKHHQTYVNNLNAAIASHLKAVESKDVQGQIALQQAIKFNGGGHINHSLFWTNLAPASSPETNPSTAPKLIAAINQKYGSLDDFKETYKTTLLGLQGSGWGWLVKTKYGELDIVTTKDQDPVVGGNIPIIGIDMWEHAYYIQYFNDKASYVKGIWNIINWKTAEARFDGTTGNLKL